MSNKLFVLHVLLRKQILYCLMLLFKRIYQPPKIYKILIEDAIKRLIYISLLISILILIFFDINKFSISY